ncbi:MAG: LptF/LptG family permease [Bacteroidales bacterium]|nr:LptF/LptG family permease [Candidatus Cryptobacteroides equifaecalis]
MRIWTPKIIDRYIMKKFIMFFFLAMLLIIGIVIIFDISEKIDYFVKNEAPLKAIVMDYYVNFVPYFINMFSPLFVFITVILFTSKMAADSEIIAILSGGVSYRRMMVPYMMSAALIAILSLGLNLYVIPRANSTRLDFEAKYIKRHNDYVRSNIHYQIAPGQFVYIDRFTDWNNTAYKFTIESVDHNKLVSKVSAESAVWDSTSCSWRLRNYTERRYTTGIHDYVKSGPAKDTTIALTITDFYRNSKTVESLPAKALDELIDTQIMRGDSSVIYAQIEKNRRVALPFSAFILTIIGVSLSSRKKRGGIGLNMGLGIGLAFTYILFLRFSEMFVHTGTLPPYIALWVPNVIFAIIAVVLYRLAPK